jgi:hypothetical protein
MNLPSTIRQRTMIRRQTFAGVTGVAMMAAAVRLLIAAPPQPAEQSKQPAEQQRAAARDKLAPLQFLVGSWKGVGQIKRGSNDGAWTEQQEWIWKFTADNACLAFQGESARYFQSGELRALEQPGQFALSVLANAGPPNNKETARRIEYIGERSEDGQLRLLADDAVDPLPQKISIRSVASGDRLVMLLERKAAGGRLQRLCEIGFTRVGSGFGQGSNGPECVVTGGFGSMTVTYKGQSYPVCCSGCRDAFNEDPEKILAEFREKKANPRKPM